MSHKSLLRKLEISAGRKFPHKLYCLSLIMPWKNKQKWKVLWFFCCLANPAWDSVNTQPPSHTSATNQRLNKQQQKKKHPARFLVTSNTLFYECFTIIYEHIYYLDNKEWLILQYMAYFLKSQLFRKSPLVVGSTWERPSAATCWRHISCI